MNAALKQSERASRKGFTLVEILAVTAIMGIVTVLAARMAVRTGNPADAAQMVAAAGSVAQTGAIAAGVPARVLICIDPTAGAKYLRSVAVVVEDSTLATSGTTYWKLSNDQLTLPLGTLFLNNVSYSNSTDTMLYDFNNSQQSQNGSTGFVCTYIEFDPTGQITNSENNIQWIFEHALENSANSAAVGENRNDVDGFIVRRLGKFVFFESPGQIQKPSSS